MTDIDEKWPPLPLEAWRETRDTLHRWTQIVGKTRLALAPHVNHWWQVPLYVSARGLTTSRIPYGAERDARGFEVEFDFVSHRLTISDDDGGRWATPLAARSVAHFYRDYVDGLRSLDLDVPLWPHPVELVEAIPFAEDEVHAAYDPAAAHRFWRALTQADRVLHRFRSGFVGKCSPVPFFWGSFDLACTRFSGAPAPAHPGGVPHLADRVTREAYSHACISAGWWPGSADGPVAEPAFYAYAYPEPPGCAEAPVRPSGPRGGRYEPALGEWIFPYETARISANPDAAVLEFLQSTYEAAAERGGWDRAVLEASAV